MNRVAWSVLVLCVLCGCVMARKRHPPYQYQAELPPLECKAPADLPPHELPGRDEAGGQMRRLQPYVEECASRKPRYTGRLVKLNVDISGATGRVNRFEVVNGSPELHRCLAVPMQGICFATFEEATFKIGYPYEVPDR